MKAMLDRLDRRYVLVGVERGLIVVTKTASVVLLARVAGPTAVGAYSVALAIGLWAGAVANFGLHYAAQARLAREDPDWREIANSALSASLTLSLILAVPAGAVSVVFLGIEAGWTTAFATAALVPTTALTHMLSGLTKGRNDFVGHLLGNSGQYLLLPALFAVLAILERLSGASAVAVFVVAVWASNLVWLRRLGAGVHLRVTDPRRALRAVSVGRFGAGFQLGEAGAARADLLAVATLASPQSLGVYALVKQVVEAIMYVPRAGGAIVLNDAAGAKNTSRGRLFLAVAQMFVTIPVLLAPEAVLRLAGGPEFVAGAAALRVLSIAGLVWGWSFVRAHLTLGGSDGRTATLWALSAAPLVAVGSWVGYASAGLVGAAVGCLVAYSLATLIFLIRPPAAIPSQRRT